MKHVVLDTNFLVSAARFKVDLKSELERAIGEAFELVISDKVVQELASIASEKKKDSPSARAALDFLASEPVRVVPTSQAVDSWISQNAARAPGAIIATNDRELVARLKLLKVRVLSLKGKSKVGFV